MGDKITTGASLTAREVAEQLHVSRMTIIRWADAGLIPFLELPHRRRKFRQEDVDRFVTDRTRGTESGAA